MANAMTVVDLANDDVPRQVSFGGASNASTNEPLEFKGTRSDKQQRLLRIRQGTLKIYEHVLPSCANSAAATGATSIATMSPTKRAFFEPTPSREPARARTSLPF